MMPRPEMIRADDDGYGTDHNGGNDEDDDDKQSNIDEDDENDYLKAVGLTAGFLWYISHINRPS